MGMSEFYGKCDDSQTSSLFAPEWVAGARYAEAGIVGIE
jgi:hypothetical protein